MLGASGEGKLRPPACAPPSMLFASSPCCVTPGDPCPSLGRVGARPVSKGSPGSRLLPGGSQPRFPRTGAGPLLSPGWGSSLLGRAPDPSFGLGIPSGLGKGSSDWLRAFVTSGPPLSPLPQRHVGQPPQGKGPGSWQILGVPHPELAAGWHRHNSPRTDFSFVPNPLPATPHRCPPPTPETAAARVADAPAKSAQLVPLQS